MIDAGDSRFAAIPFSGTLRPSQQEVVEIATRQLKAGKRQLHIVAPPGSGKTVLGLYLWAQLIRTPCAVFSPNSAIQSQWAARTDLFELPQDRKSMVSTDPRQPSLLTSLTYQSVTMPARDMQSVEDQGVLIWLQKLVDEQQAQSIDEAKVWVDDLRVNNPKYYRKQLSAYKKRIRDETTRSGESISLLHESSQATLERLANQSVGLIILDECHHLLGHWGRVLSDALPMLGNPIVIGLTATPPDRDGKDERDVARYDQFFGEIDFEVPVPAVVKDGYLAPYQDLAYFVRPTNDELKFVASADERVGKLVEDVCAAGFLADKTADPDASSKGPENAETANVLSANESKVATKERGFADADSTTASEPVLGDDEIEANGGSPSNIIEWLTGTLSSYRLPTGVAKDWSSFARRDQGFALASRQFLSSRGVSLPANVPHLGPEELPAETPPMEYLVPVLDRFVRHFLRRSPSQSHQATARAITSSLRTLGVQITDTGTRPCVSPVGRVLAYSKSKTEALIPILSAEMDTLGDLIRAVVIADFERSSAVTAQLKSLMDDETGGAIAAFRSLLTHKTTDLLEPVLLTGSTILVDDEIETEFLAQSRAWLAERSLVVELESTAVANFHQVTGSGRDWAPRVYVEMVTELFQQGLTKCLIGTRGLLGEGWDANKINVLVDLTTVTTSMSINQLRGRSFRLDPTWEQKLSNNWDVVCLAPEFSKGFDDYQRFKEKHKNLYGVTDDGAIEKGVGHVHPAFTEIKPEGLESSVTMLNAEMIERSKRRDVVRDSWKIGQPFASKSIDAVEAKFSGPGPGFPPMKGRQDPWTDESIAGAIASAVISSFAELGRIRASLSCHTGTLAGGYVRVFLEDANAEESELFSTAMKQVLGPLDRPRYVIPRNVMRRTETWLSSFLPEIVGRYFQKERTEMAMLHAVPAELGKNKSDVAVFQNYWNQWVSDGVAVYAHRGQGERMVQEAIGNGTPTIVHGKELFV
ncbi:MAG: hypothetical protein ACI87E_001733 [Mariniblastus sp.]